MLLLFALAALAAITALTLQGWVIVQMRGQQVRIEERLDALAMRLASRAADAAARERGTVLNTSTSVGDFAPHFDLTVLGGGRVTLDALLNRAKPLLLVFAEPRCGPCYELLPDLGGWQRVYGDRLTVALVSSGIQESNLAMTAEYGINLVLLQAEREVQEAYGLFQAPAAVLVTPDGRLSGGPSYGSRAIRSLVADALGLALPEAPRREIQAVGVGQVAPALRRPDLTGNVLDLARFRGTPTLLLFWSPGCPHCRELIPEIKAFEQTPHRPRMVIVSRGPGAINQEIGFASPMVLDDDHSIARAFGATGTPAAVLLDNRRVVATPVARGVTGVRTALQGLLALAAPASAAD